MELTMSAGNSKPASSDGVSRLRISTARSGSAIAAGTRSVRCGRTTRRVPSFTTVTRVKSTRRLFRARSIFSRSAVGSHREFYCPGCGTQVETEYLPPGHPITHDIEIDVEQLKEQLRKGEFVIRGQRLEVVE